MKTIVVKLELERIPNTNSVKGHILYDTVTKQLCTASESYFSADEGEIVIETEHGTRRSSELLIVMKTK